MIRVEGANKPRLLVVDALTDAFTIGSAWTGDTLILRHGMNPSVRTLTVDLACGSRSPVCYTVETDCPWLKLSQTSDCVVSRDVLTIRLDDARMPERATAVVTVKTDTVENHHRGAKIK